MWTPFAIDAKGGEMKTKGEMQTKGDHELLSSMTKEEIVDEIVIDANIDLQWPHRMSLMPPSPTCSALNPSQSGFVPCSALDPLQSGFVPWSTFYLVGKVPVLTSLDLEATTLLKMLKTLLMALKTLEMVMKTLQKLEKPYMGWISINDPFCGHLCSDVVMVPEEKT